MVNEAKNRNVGRGVILAVVLLAVVGTVTMRDRGNKADVPVPTVAQTQQGLPKLLDLGADKCIPCKAMAPILDELKTELTGRLDVVFIDVWKNPEAAKGYEFKLIPTQIFFDAEGQELFRHEGFFGRDDILAEWQKLGYTFESPARDQG